MKTEDNTQMTDQTVTTNRDLYKVLITYAQKHTSEARYDPAVVEFVGLIVDGLYEGGDLDELRSAEDGLPSYLCGLLERLGSGAGGGELKKCPSKLLEFASRAYERPGSLSLDQANELLIVLLGLDAHGLRYFAHLQERPSTGLGTGGDYIVSTPACEEKLHIKARVPVTSWNPRLELICR